MNALIIGISSGLFIIFLIGMLKKHDKRLLYGIILSGIGFLYVGFAWSNLHALVINSIQAICFLFLAYYGIMKSIYLLAIGYFMHGCWDIAYHFFNEPGLIPPHYDLFCSSLDFIICLYLLICRKKFKYIKSSHENIIMSKE